MDESANEVNLNTPHAKQPFQFRLTDALLATAWLAVLLALVTQVKANNGLLALSMLAWYLASFVYIVHRRWMTVRHGIAVFVVLALLFLLLSPGVQSQPRGGRRAACINNIHQISLALALYEQQYGCLPPAYIADAQGKPMHSWRVLILPFMQEQTLYDRYDLSEPWDGPNNSKLHNTLVPIFSCPSDRKNPGTDTNYVAVVGPGTAWPGATCTSKSLVTDGLSNSILLVEVANSGIHWMEPRDLPVAAVSAGINPKSGSGISSAHPGGVIVSLMDWQHIFLSETTPVEVLNALLTIRGGERLSDDGDGYTILPPTGKPQANR
jgi:type II secretory pathway pseudopilin PulG